MLIYEDILHRPAVRHRPSARPTSNSARPAKQNIPNRPDLAEPTQNQHFTIQSRSRPQQRHRNTGAWHGARPSRPRGTELPPPLPQEAPLSQIRQTGVPNKPNSRPQRRRNRPRHPSPATARPPRTPTQPKSPKIELPNRPNSQNPIQTRILRPPTPDRITDLPSAAAIENHRCAELEETRGFSWPAGLLIPQSPAPAKLRRSDTSNSLGREPGPQAENSQPRQGRHTPLHHKYHSSGRGIHLWNPPLESPVPKPQIPRPPCHNNSISPNQQHTPKTPQNT